MFRNPTRRSLSNPEALKTNPELVIRIKADAEAKTLIIEGENPHEGFSKIPQEQTLRPPQAW